MVEFALRMPVNEPGRVVWLAIDAKFPTEDYDRLLLAGESGDRDAESEARKSLGVRIRNEAKRIQSKYVRPPMTVEYGVMPAPVQGKFSSPSPLRWKKSLSSSRSTLCAAPSALEKR